MIGKFFPITQDLACRKNKIFVKLIYSIKINIITSFFSEGFVKFLRNSIKYVSKAVSGALSGALKVAVLRAMAIQSTFSDDSFK